MRSLQLLAAASLGAIVASAVPSVSARAPSTPEPRTWSIVAPAAGDDCAITWSVFSTNATLIRMVTEAELCFGAGDTGPVVADLDGNGRDECVLVGEFGDFGKSGGIGSSAVRALRRDAGGLSEFVVGAIARPAATYGFIPGVATDFYVAPVGAWDATGDGLPDLVVNVRWVEASGQKRAIAYFRNQLTPPAGTLAADINRDGVVNGADLTMLLVAWAQGS